MQQKAISHRKAIEDTVRRTGTVVSLQSTGEQLQCIFDSNIENVRRKFGDIEFNLKTPNLALLYFPGEKNLAKDTKIVVNTKVWSVEREPSFTIQHEIVTMTTILVIRNDTVTRKIP